MSVKWIGDVSKRQRISSCLKSLLSVENVGIIVLNIYHTLAAVARSSEYL